MKSVLNDLLLTRRSIRKYTTEPIEKEKIELLKKVALLSPTSKNRRANEFILIDDKEIFHFSLISPIHMPIPTNARGGERQGC